MASTWWGATAWMDTSRSAPSLLRTQAEPSPAPRQRGWGVPRERPGRVLPPAPARAGALGTELTLRGTHDEGLVKGSPSCCLLPPPPPSEGPGG